MIVNYHDAQRSQIDPARKRQRALTPGAFRAAHVCLGLVDRSALCYPCAVGGINRWPAFLCGVTDERLTVRYFREEPHICVCSPCDLARGYVCGRVPSPVLCEHRGAPSEHRNIRNITSGHAPLCARACHICKESRRRALSPATRPCGSLAT